METESQSPHFGLPPICCRLHPLPKPCAAAGWVQSQRNVQWYPQSLCREYEQLYYSNHHWKILLILLPWQPSHVFLVIIAVSWWWQSEKGIISPHPPLPVCHRPQCSLLRNCQDKWQVWELGSRYQSGIPSHCLLDLECSQTSRTLFLKIGDISDLLIWKLF